MTKYTEFKQVKVRYTDKGKGRVIVLLHGFMESLEIWDDFAKELSKSYRVICIDLPGFGETPSIGFIHTMELMAKCTKAVLDAEHLRRYVIVGHSMGGYVALAFADLFNDNLKGLGLFHSTALADSEQKKEGRDKAIKVVKINPRNYIKIFFEPLFAPQHATVFRSEIKTLEARAEKFSKRAIVNALEGMKDRKKLDWLLQMSKFPILFIIGKQDAVIPFESVLNQTKIARTSVVLQLENVGHMGFLEAKSETVKAVKKFARRCFLKK